MERIEVKKDECSEVMKKDEGREEGREDGPTVSLRHDMLYCRFP